MKVAIVGDAQSTRDEAPFADPSWEIWGINHGWAGHPRQLPRCTRIFDIHDPRLNGIAEAWDDDPPTYGKAMQLVPQVYPGVVMYRHPLNTMWTEGDVRDFPYDEILQRYGRERSLLTSGVAWMIAFALSLPFPPHHPKLKLEALAIYGVDMDPAAEYSTQRTGGEFWVGRAKERLGDANVIIPEGSLLCSTPYLYGIEDEQNARMIKRIDRRETQADKALAQFRAEEEWAKMGVVQMQVRASEIDFWKDVLDPDKVADRLAYLGDHERRWREQVEDAKMKQRDAQVELHDVGWERDNWTIPSPVKSK